MCECSTGWARSVRPTSPTRAPTSRSLSNAPNTWPSCAAMARRRGAPMTRFSCQIRSKSAEARWTSVSVESGRTSIGSAIGQEVPGQPGHHLGPAGHLVDQDVLVAGMGSAPDRAEPVEGGHAEGRGEVPVAPATDPGRANVVAEPQEPPVQGLGGFPGEGPPVEPAADGDPGSGDRWLQRLYRLGDPLGLVVAPHPSVHRAPGRLRHDVGGGPSADRPDHHGGPDVGPGQRVDPLDLGGDLGDRAHSLGGVQAGVGRPALDPDGPAADAFPGHLHRAARGRLHHQRRPSPPSLFLDYSSRRGAPDLLVAGEQDRDGAAHLRHGVQRLDDSGLHVERSGPAGHPVRHREGPLRQGAGRPHRVEVAQEQDRSVALPSPPAMVEVADPLRPRPEDLGAQLVDHRGAPLQSFRVRGEGLRLHQPTEGLDHPGRAGGHQGAATLRRSTPRSYASAARVAPITGPTKYTHRPVYSPPATAGPSDRAGFMEPPVNGPPIMMSIAITNPIASPATLLNEPSGSTAVANTTQTRRNVSTASIVMAWASESSERTRVAPRAAGSQMLWGTTHRSSPAPAIPATSWVTT